MATIEEQAQKIQLSVEEVAPKTKIPTDAQSDTADSKPFSTKDNGLPFPYSRGIFRVNLD